MFTSNKTKKTKAINYPHALLKKTDFGGACANS